MGYAIFANRKLMLTNQINMMQLELTQIMEQKQRLLQFSANVATGVPMSENIFADYSNFQSYMNYINDAETFIQNYSGFGENLANEEVLFEENNALYKQYVLNPVQQEFFEDGQLKAGKTEQQYEDALNAKLQDWQNGQLGTTDDEKAAALQAYQEFYFAKEQHMGRLEDRGRQNLYQTFYEDNVEKQLAADENALELKQKRIETKLTALKQDLQSVEQAEGQAIQMATPKYSGLG